MDPRPFDSSPPAGPAHRPWVPVRSLGPRHRSRIARHLLALDDHSRYLRFGYAATDAQIARYVDAIDFERDEVFGIFNRKLEPIAVSHLAYLPSDATHGRSPAAEFGVSVLPHARRRGFGARLFEHAVLHARNRGIKTMIVHALSENAAMLALARRAGATVARSGPESEASLSLPPDSLGSHVDELLGERAAEFDYGLKRSAHQVQALLGTSDARREFDPSEHDA